MEAKKLADAFSGNKAKTTETNLFNILFKAKEDAHITHLTQPTKSMADHLALGDFYDALDGLLDTFIETYFGLYGIKPISFSASGMGDNLISYMENLHKQIVSEKKNFTDGYLMNQIDELEQLTVHTLYKLKYVTC